MTDQAPAPAKTKPTDVDAFLNLLPNLVGSFASKHNDPKTASDLAINLAREETAHMVAIGQCTPTTVCRDGRPLALYPGAQNPQSPFGLGSGQSRQGAMVAQFETTNVQKIQGL